MRQGLSAACFLLVFASGVVAEPLASIPNPRVRNGTWVTDMAGGLQPGTVTYLNEAIDNVEKSHGIEMAVVVIRSLDGLTIEDAAEKLFKLWGIGKKGRDNGLLFLWSTGDRKVRVEVGYGLEGVLPDGKVGAILDNYVIPRFKANNFDGGVIDGVNALLAAARNEPVSLPERGTFSYDFVSWLPSWWPAVPGGSLVIGLVAAFRKWRRYRRRNCPQCHARMVLISDSEDDALLQLGQLKEEQIGSVDYDVWRCPSCSHSFTLRYAKWLSTYSKCPQCFNRTKSSKETVIAAATTSSEGTMRVVETCAFCSFTNEYTKVIPRRSESSSSSSSGSSGGGSSFGGGSSGGGGASRGY